jgi:hypothetical protein
MFTEIREWPWRALMTVASWLKSFMAGNAERAISNLPCSQLENVGNASVFDMRTIAGNTCIGV